MIQVVFIKNDGSTLGETLLDNLDRLKVGTCIGLIEGVHPEQLFTVLVVRQEVGYAEVVVRQLEPCWN